ncbi:hypothetical protein [Rheinheimera texasensis]|uniref:hypothetical protein n=1 Tax=Rheinheimera texasensis TaxID=306205 RepID=UPI0012FF37C6|nr:hypothetical protein [Rheinheimera texasensis]
MMVWGLVRRWALTICLTTMAPQHALAHGGEDHGDEDKAALTLPAEGQSRRAYASSELFELVLVAPEASENNASLQIYLDYYADNSPVKDAVIELSSSAFSGTAKMLQPGLYQLDVKTLPATSHAIALTIEAGDDIDLLNTKLDLTPHSTTVEHQHSWTEYSTQYVIGVGVLLVGLLLWRLSRQRKTAGKTPGKKMGAAV